MSLADISTLGIALVIANNEFGSSSSSSSVVEQEKSSNKRDRTISQPMFMVTATRGGSVFILGRVSCSCKRHMPWLRARDLLGLLAVQRRR
jgi:hypothetical protein